MNFVDINEGGEKVILLIHPMLSSAEGMKFLIADNILGDYRYIIPDLSAHGKSREVYKSAEMEANKIKNYLIENGIDKINLAFGASLGGVVLLNLLNSKDIIVDKCVFEGASLWQKAYFLDFLFKKIFLRKHKKALKDKNFAVKKMTALYGAEFGKIMAESFIRMDDESIVNIIHDCSFVKIPDLSKNEQEKLIFCYGSKEFDYKEAKKVIPKKLPYVKLKVWEGYGHCDKITKDNLEYCKFLESQI